MTLFALDETRVRALVALVTAGAPPAPAASDEAGGDINVGDRFARAAWSSIAEPGDGDAGALVGALGAGTALGALVDRWPHARVLDAVRDHDPALAAQLAVTIAAAFERWMPRVASLPVTRAIEAAARVGARLVVPGDREWPEGVDDLGRHAPLALWYRGRREGCMSLRASIALVGARAASGYGEHVAMEAAAGLVDRGLTIVSGAAYGIDGMAHRAALASRGTTVAFLAGGVDRFYPSGHDALLNRITADGAVFSELACGAAPTRWRFLQRNRLIAAASQATVVLEAGWRSGSLNTAGHAAALGRPLGAVPGPVTSPTSAGCHRLIRDYDAVCVTDAEQMAQLRSGLDPAGLTPLAGADDRSPEEVRVLDALSVRSPRIAAEIARRSGLGLPAVQAILGGLALDNLIREHNDGWLAAPRRSPAGRPSVGGRS